MNRCLLAVACTVSLGASLAFGENEWTRFRGPNGTGVSEAHNIPVEWTVDDFQWRVPVRGDGHSQPVVWDNKLFLTSSLQDGDIRLVLCFNATNGQQLWEKSFSSHSHRKHKLNSFASSTPTVDAERVYAVFSTPDAYTITALDHEGEVVWSQDLGPYESQHSCGSSPILFEDLVILGNEQDGPSSLIALEAATGKLRWKTPRRNAKVAYSTPCIYQPSKDADPQLIFNSQAHGVSAVDARTGRPLWEAPVFDKRSCSSPILAGDCFIGSCGSGGGGNYVVGVKPGGSGDVSDSHFAFKIDRAAPYVPTPITKDDHLFLWSDKGIVSCVQASTGKVLLQKRIGGNYFGSPIHVRDRLYGMSADGECVVLAADETMKVLARNPIVEGTHSTPAVAQSKLYLRTFNHLICLGGE